MRTIAFTAYALRLAVVFVAATLLADLFGFPFWDRRYLAAFVAVFLVFCGLTLSVPRLRRLLPRCTCLAFATVLTLGLSELLFRALLVQPVVPADESAFEAAVAATWPYEVEVRKNPKTLRIVALADSFGRAGDDGNFTFLLHEKLQGPGRPVEVVNVSEWGLELRDELEMLRRFGLRYDPDIVLHGFFAGNDFDLPAGELTSFGGVVMRYSGGPQTLRPRRFVLRKWLIKRRQALDEQARKDEELGRDSEATFSTATFLELERRRAATWTSRELGARWNTVERLLDAIRRQAEAAGARYALVIHPDQYQVDAKLRQEVWERSSEGLSQVDMELPQRMLLGYCASRQIPCLDLLPPVRAAAADADLYLLNDTHYNLEGNRVAAELIHDFVVRSFPELGEGPELERASR